jgi:hypothetical protein
VLTGKFMGWRDDAGTFFGWSQGHGADPTALRAAIAAGRDLLHRFLGGDDAALPGLLDTLRVRWDAYYAPVPDKKRACAVLRALLASEPALARRWLRWYDGQPYDPRGGPDLFAVHPETDHWCFIEVKSLRDNLSPVQWAWIEGFHREVAPAVALLRLVPAEPA